MSTTTMARPRPSNKKVLETLRNDPIAGLTLGIFIAIATLYVVPILDPAQMSFLSLRLGPLLLLSLAIAALRYQLERIKAREDREFWNDLLKGYICWWLAAALILFFPSPERKPFAIDLITSVLYALYYVALLMAVEGQPHHRHRWRPLDLERWLSWATVTAVVFGLTLYFPFMALWTDPEAYSSGIPDLLLYLVLDGYLTFRLVYLCGITSSAKWKLLYGLLAGTALTNFGSEIAEGLALATQEQLWHWDTLSNIWLYVPYLLIVAAARLRHHPFPWEPPLPASRIRLEENLPGPLGQTMVFILLFPLIHFGCDAFGVLGPASRPQREILVLIWLPILGLIALFQYRILDKTLKQLKDERQGAERALHKTQKELRLAQERQSTSEAVQASDARFSEAFRACPDVMAISRVEDGRVVEANESCLRVLGYKLNDFVGHTAEELGLWVRPEVRADALEKLARHGHVTVEAEFRTRTGEAILGIFSARTIDIDGSPHLFSVTRDVSETRRRDLALQRRVSALDSTSHSIWAVDHEGRLIFWNRAAQDEFNVSAGAKRELAQSEKLAIESGGSKTWLVVSKTANLL